MARTAPQPTKAIVAAGAPVTLDKGAKTIKALRPASGLSWHEDLWRYYDTIGEYRYGVDLTANMVAKATLQVEKYNPATYTFDPVTEGPAFEALMELYNGPVSQPEFLRSASLNLLIPGEFFVVSWNDGTRKWRTVPRSSITRHAGKVRMDGETLPEEGTLVFRVWEPHPTNYDVPNSPSRALVDTLAEIHRLTQHIQAQVISRLASAGILFLPDDIDVSPPEGLVDADKLASMTNGDKFVYQLTATMEKAIQDRSSASAVVPIVSQLPAEAIEAIKHMTLWSELDENARSMRDDALARLAIGMDVPPEAITGQGEANHWQQWASDESAIKAHTQPLLGRITSGLTQGYLHPAIKDQVPDWQMYRIGADDSKIRTRPNRSKESIELYDRGTLSASAMRRENGFDEKDAMTGKQLQDWIVKKVASGSTTPELVAAAIAELGVALDVQPDSEDSQEARPDRSLKDHPERSFPQDRPQEQKTPEGLVAAADVLTLRALERAGNKIKNMVQTRPAGIVASDYYKYAPEEGKCTDADYLLTDAWAHVGEYADRYGLDSDSLTEALDAYTRQLIVNKADRDPDVLRKYLEVVEPC